MLLNSIFLLVLLIFGAAIGSFIGVLVYRLHEHHHGVLSGRSMCPECKEKLKPLDLIPLISYLTLRGKCRYCNIKISYMYPVLELVSGGLFALLFLKFPFVDATLAFSGKILALYALNAFYLFVLIFTFFYDLRYLKISDEILLPAILIGLIATLGYPATPHMLDALLGAAIATVFFGLQIIVSRGAWLGLGDLRVGALIGVMFGWKLTLIALLLAYLIGSVASIFIVAHKKKFFGVKVPFGPFLAMGAVATMFFGNEILKWYLGTLGF